MLWKIKENNNYNYQINLYCKVEITRKKSLIFITKLKTCINEEDIIIYQENIIQKGIIFD
jgi:hypothetical protein